MPNYFVEAYDVDPVDQLKLQAAVQTYVDQSISKTINLPAAAEENRYRDVFMQAYQLGLKGCTMFRSSPGKEAVLGLGVAQV